MLLHGRVWGEWVQQLLWRLPRKIEYLPSSHFLEDDAKHIRKVRRNAFQRYYRLLQQYPRFNIKKDILYNLIAMIGQQYNKNVNDGWFCRILNKRTNSVRTIEELVVEFVPQTFKRYFQNFPLNANQQFVEILTTIYIVQSHSIYNISGKVVR